MFCSKCGKQINNDALFCTFCGSPTALAAPVAPAAPAMPAAASVPAGVPTPGSIPMSSESVPMNAAGWAPSVPMQAAEAPEDIPGEGYAETVPVGSMPMAEENSDDNRDAADLSEPLYGENYEQSAEPELPDVSAPVHAEFPARESAVPELVTAGNTGTVIDFSTPIQTAPPAEDGEKPAKYYTFGHIALCLAAVGVMAIVAGVFAGLYFSVI